MYEVVGAAICGLVIMVWIVFRRSRRNTGSVLDAGELRVVITGGTRGLGRALAEKFVAEGAKVFVCGRSEKTVRETVEELGANAGGVCCDVGDAADVDRLAEEAEGRLGGIDVWINNAATICRERVADGDLATLERVLQVNLRGTIYGYRSATRVIARQGRPGNIFNVMGKGGDGKASPLSPMYGCSKAAVVQLTRSLAEEAKSLSNGVGVHLIQPGMVTTDLLIRGNEENRRALWIFNVLADTPQEVADFLTAQILAVPLGSGPMVYIKYLTPATVIGRFLCFIRRKNRHFDLSL